MSTNVVLLDIFCLKDSAAQSRKPTTVASPTLLLSGNALSSAGASELFADGSGHGDICLTHLVL